MVRHVFQPRVFYNAIGLGDPVHLVEDGDTVVTQTIDARGFGSEEEQVATGPNPVMGPFFVKGAEPGHALEVTIDRMTPNRATRWSFSPVASNIVDPGSCRASLNADARSGRWTTKRGLRGLPKRLRRLETGQSPYGR